MLFSKYAKKLEGKIENAHPSQLDRLGTKLERTYKFQRFFSINESRDALTGKLYGLLMKQGFEASTLLNGQQDALEQYTKAITLAPERFEAYLKRGEILHELKKYAGAIQDFDKAGSILIISPEYDADAAMKLARIYSSRGESHLQCKNYGNAEKDYDYAIMHYRSAMAQSRPGETLDKMTRGLEESYIGAGNVKVELKQFIEAKKCFDEAERLPTATEYRMHAIFANFWVAVEKAGLLEKTSDIKNPWKIKSA